MSSSDQSTFLQLGNQVDESAFFRQVIDEAMEQSADTPYAERRAASMNSKQEEDFDLEDEVAMAFEEVTRREKQMKQVIEVTNFLFTNQETSQERLAAAKQDLDEEMHKAQEAEMDRAAASKELEQQARRIEILEDSTHSMQREMQAGRDQLATSKAQERLKNEQMAQMEDRIRTLDQELQHHKQSEMRLEQSIPQLEGEISELNAELENEKNKHRDVQIAYEESKKDVEYVRAKEKKAKERSEKYKRADERLRKEMKEYEERIIEMKSEMQTVTNLNQQMVKEAQRMEQNGLFAQDNSAFINTSANEQDMSAADINQQPQPHEISQDNIDFTNTLAEPEDNFAEPGLGNEFSEDFVDTFNNNPDDDQFFEEQPEATEFIENDKSGQRLGSRFIPTDIAEQLGKRPSKISFSGGQRPSLFDPQQFDFNSLVNRDRNNSLFNQERPVETCDADCQTDEQETPRVYGEMETQTETTSLTTCKTQTDRMITFECESQTWLQTQCEEVQTEVHQASVEVQAGTSVDVAEGVCQTSLTYEESSEDSRSVTGGQSGPALSPLKRNITIDPKQKPSTTKAGELRIISFKDTGSSKGSKDADSTSGTDSKRQLTQREKIKNQEYQQNRDPMYEFFTLTCSSVKINSPHMNLIATMDQLALYETAKNIGVPFFKWQSWIETTLQKEVLQQLFKQKKKKAEDNARNENSQRRKSTTSKKKEKMRKSLQSFLDQSKATQVKQPAAQQQKQPEKKGPVPQSPFGRLEPKPSQKASSQTTTNNQAPQKKQQQQLSFGMNFGPKQ